MTAPAALAVAVARQLPLDTIYALAAKHAARAGGAGAGWVVRFGDGRTGTVVGRAGGRGAGCGGTVALDGPGRTADAETARSGRVRIRIEPERDEDRRSRVGVSVPVEVRGAVWGALVAVTVDAGPVESDVEQRLAAAAQLVGVAIENADEAARLVSQATTDPLTGLLNHRAFQERFEAEFDRASRYGRPLSLVLLDLDHFKLINDAYGHGAGNETLIEVARHLSYLARPSDLIARIGGDEFALVLPETPDEGAVLLAERCRAMLGAAPVGVAAHLTVSVGVCDLAHARTHAELVRLADDALYWAKGHGRDRVVLYRPDVVRALTHSERTDRLERAYSLLALRSLARAIDAREPTGQGHSERVSDLVRRLAIASGWTAERAERLAATALIHDVGKLGVPDRVLVKPGPLTGAEFEAVKTHAALSAQIAAEVFDEEQTTWIHQHHERADGSGYPDGLSGGEISDGARLLAVADSWDVMTTERVYRGVMSSETALRICLGSSGTQFFREACSALALVVGDAGAEAC